MKNLQYLIIFSCIKNSYAGTCHSCIKIKKSPVKKINNFTQDNRASENFRATSARGDASSFYSLIEGHEPISTNTIPLSTNIHSTKNPNNINVNNKPLEKNYIEALRPNDQDLLYIALNNALNDSLQQIILSLYEVNLDKLRAAISIKDVEARKLAIKNFFKVRVVPKFLQLFSKTLIDNQSFYNFLIYRKKIGMWNNREKDLLTLFLINNSKDLSQKIYIVLIQNTMIFDFFLNMLWRSDALQAILINYAEDYGLIKSGRLQFQKVGVSHTNSYKMDLKKFEGLNVYFKNLKIKKQLVKQIFGFFLIDGDQKSRNLPLWDRGFCDSYIDEETSRTVDMYSFDAQSNIQTIANVYQCNQLDSIDKFRNTCDSYLFFLSFILHIYADDKNENTFDLNVLKKYINLYQDPWTVLIIMFCQVHLHTHNRAAYFPEYILTSGWASSYKNYLKQSNQIGDIVLLDEANQRLLVAIKKRQSFVKKYSIEKDDYFKNGWEIASIIKDNKYCLGVFRCYQDIYFHESVLKHLSLYIEQYHHICLNVNWPLIRSNIINQFISEVLNNNVEYNTQYNLQNQYNLYMFISTLINYYVSNCVVNSKFKISKNVNHHSLSPKIWNSFKINDSVTYYKINNDLCINIPFCVMFLGKNKSEIQKMKKHFCYFADQDNPLLHGVVIPIYFNADPTSKKNKTNFELDENGIPEFVKKRLQLYIKVADDFYSYLKTSKSNILNKMYNIDLLECREQFMSFFKKTYCDQNSEGKYDLKRTYDVNDALCSFYEYCIYPMSCVGEKRFKSTQGIISDIVVIGGLDKQYFIEFFIHKFFNWVKYFSFAEYIYFEKKNIMELFLLTRENIN